MIKTDVYAKVIAAINMTLDGYCDHIGGIVNEAFHEHYSQLIRHGGPILYGSVTNQLMEYWQHWCISLLAKSR